MDTKNAAAYDLHFDELRQVLVKHLNQYPNALLSDLAELIATKAHKAHEGMVVMQTSEFDEVCKQMEEDGINKGLETGKKLRDISVKAANETAVTLYEMAIQGYNLPESLHKKLADVNGKLLN